jgi:hypothetical protein
MKTAEQIVFRRLTPADFFNINKPRGAEARGGGQSYIDFPTSAVRPANWKSFFSGVKMTTTQSGPLWKFTANSLGLNKSQTAEIGRRRAAPTDPTSRKDIPNLVVYLIRTTDGEYWAGWFQAPSQKPTGK